MAFRYILSRAVTVFTFFITSAMSQTTPVGRAVPGRLIVHLPQRRHPRQPKTSTVQSS